MSGEEEKVLRVFQGKNIGNGNTPTFGTERSRLSTPEPSTGRRMGWGAEQREIEKTT